MKILEVINLSKSFGKKKVIDEISFEIFKNEVFGLIGKNASGKSTIINIIAGLYKKDKGKIYFMGKEISYPEIFSMICILKENPSFYSHLSLIENYKIFSKIYGNKENYEILEKLKLTSFLKNKVSTLSQGTRQKLAISLCLFSERELYILDEPFEHLDPETRNFIKNRIKELKENGKTLLITTHREEDVQLFDRVLILENGKIRFKGSKNDKEIRRFFL